MNNKEKIKQIKYLRLKPEERFVLDHLIDLDEYTHNEYPNSIFYKKNDILLFEWNKKTGYFWCDYNNFWSILKSKYNLNNNDIKQLIKIIVEKYLVKKNKITYISRSTPRTIIEDDLVKNDITIMGTHITTFLRVEKNLVKKDIIPEKAGFSLGNNIEKYLIKNDSKIGIVHNVIPVDVEDQLIKKDIIPGAFDLNYIKNE